MEKTVGAMEKLEESVVETAADYPCVYKGKIITIDVRKLASKIQ